MSVIAPVGLGALAEADDNHIKVQLSGGGHSILLWNFDDVFAGFNEGAGVLFPGAGFLWGRLRRWGIR